MTILISVPPVTKSNLLNCNFILVILPFTSKILVLVCSLESFIHFGCLFRGHLLCNAEMKVKCQYFCGAFMHDVSCKFAPPNLLDLLTRAGYVHSYNTRSASAGEHRQQSHSFSRIGCKIWNVLPEHLQPKSKTSLKNCFQQTLLQLLEHEGTYIDIHTLIQNNQAFIQSLLSNCLM